MHRPVDELYNSESIYAHCASEYANGADYKSDGSFNFMIINSHGKNIYYKANRYEFESDVMYVCTSRYGSTINFVFLGSNDIGDWRSNTDAEKTCHDTHRGFDTGASLFRKVIKESIRRSDAKDLYGFAGFSRIGFIGYSRGAAIAERAAVNCSDDFALAIKESIHVTVWGKPMTGGPRYNRRLCKVLHTDQYVMGIITGDTVVDTPPSEWGYIHNPNCIKIILTKPWWGALKIPFIGIKLHLSYPKSIKALMKKMKTI